MLSATEFVALLRDALHAAKDGFPLFRTGHLIYGGIERPLFLPIMGTEQVQQGLLFLIAVGILVRYLLMNGFKLLPDLAMLVSHDGRRPAFGHTRFLFPEREEQILFPHDMALQADLESFERVLSRGEIRPFQLLKGLEQFIQPIMVLFKKFSDGFLFTHYASLLMHATGR